MSFDSIFAASDTEKALVSDNYTRPALPMSFMLDIPSDLAVEIYTVGASYNLNKTASLTAVFMAGARQFIKEAKKPEKSSGAKGESSKSKTKEPATE